MIEVQGLSHRLGKSTVLEDINLSLNPGQITAIIGPNGAGKSTLLNLVARQSTVQSGRVSLDGMDIQSMSYQALALRMAVVAQQTGVASRVRIRDLVGFGRWPHHLGRPQAADREKTAEAMERFELSDLSHRFLDEVSGGQRQRAFVAMAYCQDTDWLLLDEPLNNLDLRHATALMVHLKELASREGKGVAIVIHDLNYAVSFADQIIALNTGKLALFGATKEVANTSSLTELFATEVELIETYRGHFVHHHTGV